MIPVENLSEIFYRKNLLTGEVMGPMKKETFLTKIKEEIKEEPLNHWLDMKKVACYPSNKWNYSGNDLILEPIGRFDDSYAHYIVYSDGYGRIVDPRRYMKESLSCDEEKIFCNTYRNYFKKKYDNYKYRNGPVPYTSKRKGGCSGSKKYKGIKRVFKYYTDPEYGTYIRKKAIPFQFGDWWDVYEPYKLHDSWKNHKKRKQWM